MLKILLGMGIGAFLLWAVLILTESPPRPWTEVFDMTTECWECKKKITYREYVEFGGVCRNCAKYYKDLHKQMKVIE